MTSPIPRDVREFLDNYDDIKDDERINTNLEFYQNKRRCRPDNLLIDEIHDKWKGDYSKLEYKHGFIQWLFPIQEYGMNSYAQPLQRHEITAMKKDPAIIARVLKSYRLILDFYGMNLDSSDTGRLSRVKPEAKCQERYRNLVRSSHNYLRISRILKCLSELGLERLNAGFLLHILNEQSEHQELNNSSLKSSMDRWKVRSDHDFVFTREMYEKALERRKETGSLRGEDARITLP
ncbi:unnamed protein product [Somion occarium]|uniref:Opioid growth factor receptor (OGFr) conserved domain-containing protein n=1 Tax=Somion occarium TaxID=3059160 RepID=A0ABP1DY63_9APHY